MTKRDHDRCTQENAPSFLYRKTQFEQEPPQTTGIGIRGEAEASVKLDGETQEEPNAELSPAEQLEAGALEHEEPSPFARKWGVKVGDKYYGVDVTIEDIKKAMSGAVICDNPERISFAYGNVAIDNPVVTSEMVERAAQNEQTGALLGEVDWRVEGSFGGKQTRQDVLAQTKQLFEDAHTLMSLKNHDYAADKSPFRNFEICADMAGVSVEQVFLQYFGQKVARLRSFTEQRQLKVKNESVRDTMLDICNYAALFYCWCIQRGYFTK